MMNKQVRQLLAQYGSLPAALEDLGNDADLYAAGLSSHGSVQLMLALEDTFDVEFPDHLLNRKTFASISAIEAAVNGLVGERDAA